MGEKRQGDIEDNGDDAKRLKPDDEVDGDGSEDDERLSDQDLRDKLGHYRALCAAQERTCKEAFGMY